MRLDERDLLFDTVPKPARTPPDWLRIFAVEKLQRQPDRIYTGRARIAFYRPGRQAMPIFQVTVVSRTTKAINYHHRSGSTHVDFRGTELMPGA